MLLLAYLVLFVFAHVGLVGYLGMLSVSMARRAEGVLAMFAFIAFIVLSVAATNIEVVDGGVTAVEQPGLVWYCRGMAGVALVLAIASIRDYIPDVKIDQSGPTRYDRTDRQR